MSKPQNWRERIQEIRLRVGWRVFMISQVLDIDPIFIMRCECGFDEDEPCIEFTEEMWMKYQKLEKIIDAMGRMCFDLWSFMMTPHSLMGGQLPRNLLNSDEGFTKILAVIESAKSGDMA